MLVGWVFVNFTHKLLKDDTVVALIPIGQLKNLLNNIVTILIAKEFLEVNSWASKQIIGESRKLLCSYILVEKSLLDESGTLNVNWALESVGSNAVQAKWIRLSLALF